MIRHFCDLCDAPAVENLSIRQRRFFNERNSKRGTFEKQPHILAILSWELKDAEGAERPPDLCGACLVKMCEEITESARHLGGMLRLRPEKPLRGVDEFQLYHANLGAKITELQSMQRELLSQARELPVPANECLRVAMLADVYVGAVLWYPEDDPPCFHIVESDVNPFGGYTAEDGCIYGLDGAYVEAV